MKTIRFSILISAIICLCLYPAFSMDQIGEIVYMEEDVEIIRDGEAIDTEEIDIGSKICNFDHIRTSEEGFAEIEINSPKTAHTTIKVSPGTSFYFEINSLGGKEKTTIGMLGGSLALKVKKISGSRSVEVKTEYATMGVRGTSFDVTTSPSGEILITCDEGKVACRDASGKELYALPGKAVEKGAGEVFKQITVAVSDLKTFQKEWYTERLELFKANALKAVKYYALRYLKLKNEFEDAYQNLLNEKRILDKWMEEDRKKTIGTKIEIMREKKKIIGYLFKIRKNLFIFERVYFRLVELNRYFNQGYGRGLLRPGLSASKFFIAFNRDKQDLARKMAHIRYIFKLYARRNDGSLPTDLFEQDESDFFGDTSF